VAAREHVLLIVQHHAITDGISLAILGRDLAAAYSAALRGVSPELPLLGVAYIDYAAWQREQHGGDAFEAELAWWRQTLTGAPGLLELPVDRPRPPTMSTAGAQLQFAAPAAVSQGLQQLATAQQTTAFVVVLAALQVIILLKCRLFEPVHYMLSWHM
jgi:Condensation domain